MAKEDDGARQRPRSSGEASAPRPPLLEAKDVGVTLALPVLALTAAVLPRRFWPPLTRSIGSRVPGLLARSVTEIAERMRSLAGTRPLAQAPLEAARVLAGKELEKTFLAVRSHLGGLDDIPVEVTGREHIEEGLAAGRGVILWVSHFQWASLLSKVGLCRAGYRLVHLSHPRHGLSSTRYGMAVLNPVHTRAEGRYLAERVVLSLASPVAATRTLVRRLRDNALVSITVRPTGARPVTVPFLNGTLTVATGAPDLAFATGASLLPVHTLEHGSGSFPQGAAGDSRFEVRVEAPIPVDRQGRREAAAREAAAEYARRLEKVVLDFPGQWIPWSAV